MIKFADQALTYNENGNSFDTSNNLSYNINIYNTISQTSAKIKIGLGTAGVILPPGPPPVGSLPNTTPSIFLSQIAFGGTGSTITLDGVTFTVNFNNSSGLQGYGSTDAQFYQNRSNLGVPILKTLSIELKIAGVESVPEPSSLLLTSLGGLFAIAGLIHRRTQRC